MHIEFVQQFKVYVLPLPSGSHHSASLWAGTNGGSVFAFMIRMPSVEHRADEPITAHPGENWADWTGTAGRCPPPDQITFLRDVKQPGATRVLSAWVH